MRTLHIDIETFSALDITDCGHYRYALDPSFDVLLFAYAFDDNPVEVAELAAMSEANRSAFWREWAPVLMDPEVRKVAHNASFERVCLSVMLRRRLYLRPDQWLDPMQWDCTMVLAQRCGLPASLAQVGEALHFDEQKMTEGKRLIRTFCRPNPKAAGLFGSGSDRILPGDAPEDWELFVEYCRRDVEVEKNIHKALSWYEVSETERLYYAMDQDINDRGVRCDLGMAEEAQRIDSKMKARLVKEAADLTGLSNPNSPAQLKTWLSGKLGREVTSLNKTEVAELRKTSKDPELLRLLAIRAEAGKTSNAKYDAMLSCACEDGRIRGLTQFYGTRTGRWAGRLVQMQNLPQNHMDLLELDYARGLVKEGDLQTLELCFGNVPDTLSQLIRTSFIPKAGASFVVCDFSAIEARVLAWEAGETWVLDAFRAGKDIYCETASQMFHVPVEKHGQNAELRQKGKIAVLALGYGGGVGALDKMGGARMGMTEDEEGEIVTKWRQANPHIVRFWSDVETSFRRALAFRTVETAGLFTFRMEGDVMTVQLPSRRRICYQSPEITFGSAWAYLSQTEAQKATSGTENRIRKEKKELHLDKYWNDRDGRLSFMGLDQTSKAWTRLDTFGGKLVENLTQAVARDCLCEVMQRLNDGGYDPVFHVHDEVICEVCTELLLPLKARIEKEFTKSPSWAKDLPLKGAGYTGDYYFKD